MSQSHQILSAGAPQGEEHLSPSLAGGARGVWSAWQAYHAGQERILARYCAPDGSLGPLEQVTAAQGRHASPHVALFGGEPLVIWLAGAGDDDLHRVVWAQRTPNGWAPPDPVAPGHSAALQLHAASSGGQFSAGSKVA